MCIDPTTALETANLGLDIYNTYQTKAEHNHKSEIYLNYTKNIKSEDIILQEKDAKFDLLKNKDVKKFTSNYYFLALTNNSELTISAAKILIHETDGEGHPNELSIAYSGSLIPNQRILIAPSLPEGHHTIDISLSLSINGKWYLGQSTTASDDNLANTIKPKKKHFRLLKHSPDLDTPLKSTRFIKGEAVVSSFKSEPSYEENTTRDPRTDI